MSVDKERLFIKKIEIQNAGRFYGSGHSITLSDSSDKNITVIIGLSGRGKSTIHDLIYWCLYGEHKQHAADERRNLDYGLINVDALNSLSRGNSVTASITLSLHNSKEEKYLITREITATFNRESTRREFNPENNSQVPTGIDFEVTAKMKRKNIEGEIIQDTDTTRINNEIKMHFPQHLSDFFLFDGENLIKFQNHQSSDFIRDGITKVSGLGILDLLSKHADKTATDIQKHIGGKSAGAAPYSAKVERLREQISKIESEIADHEKNRKKYQSLHEDVSEKIKQNKDGAKLHSDQEKARKNKAVASKDLKRANEQIKNMVFEKIPQLLIKETLEKSEEIFARLEDEDKIPPSISRGAIDKILSSDPLRCVCGREFEKDETDVNAPWLTLNRIKGAIIEDDLSQGISLGRELISRIIDSASITKTSSDYSELIETRRSKRNDIQEYDAEIENLGMQLTNIKYAQNQNLGSLKKQYWDMASEESGNIRLKQEDCDSKKQDLEENQKRLDEEIAKEGRYEKEANKITLAQSVGKFTKKFERKIEEIFRNKTEKTTSKYFLESAPQKQDFERVNISSNYDISVKDSDGYTAHLSKGQAHVLGLSYVAGIREITHTNTFLIIDSPLHNISGIARNQISEVFSKYLPGVQIVLLVTDTEYLQSDPDGAEPVRGILRRNDKVWKEYSIEEIKVDGSIASREIKEYHR